MARKGTKTKALLEEEIAALREAMREDVLERDEEIEVLRRQLMISYRDQGLLQAEIKRLEAGE